MLVVVSLVVNLAVLAPVCAGLVSRAAWAEEAFGPPTPARSILLSIYGTIFAASAVLLARPEPAAVAALLGVQVLYKLTTPITVGTVRHPVVASNLAIAALHAVTLGALGAA